MAVIRGEWATCRVWIDDRELSRERVHTIYPSLARSNWGDGGSGAAQLALVLLLETTTKEMALLWYQEVKRQIIARLPQADFTRNSQEIISFITEAVSTELVQGPGESRKAGGGLRGCS